MKWIITGIVVFSLIVAFLLWSNRNEQSMQSISNLVAKPTHTVTPTPSLTPPPETYIIPQKLHVFQTFNNCGPASLSMLLSYNNINASQEELGLKLRPYQNPQGDNDDKSVTLEELAAEAENYNLISYHRPNGDLDLLKLLISNDIPVVVRTWLNAEEDIGHYRIVRGYDDATQEIIQDDSYQNKNLRFSYDEFLSLWQPFNYEYLIIVPKEKEQLIATILQEEMNEKNAWQNALNRAMTENQEGNVYTTFNQVVALFHLDRYQEAKTLFEQIQNRLPRRMLWYQLEPIQAYVELGEYEKVMSMTSAILNDQNRGYSELYILRGDAYKAQGDIERARQEYELAVFYNKNLTKAQDALNNLE